MRWFAILGILAYRVLVRPIYHRVCLHEESCSTYAIRVLRVRGLSHGVPLILARLRSCRMPVAAYFLIDARGYARMLSATTYDGSPLAPKAAEMLAAEAHAVHRSHEGACWMHDG